MKKTFKRLMAYIYMPLIFAVIGYGILWVAIAPAFDLVYNVGSMVMAQEVPGFNNELGNVFDGNANSPFEQPETVNYADVILPTFGQQYGHIECSRIGLDAPVYFGDSNDILRVGVGQYIGSFLPGFGRPLLLCAHNTTYFKPLQVIEPEDIIIYRTSYGVYMYKVTAIEVKDHNDSSAYDLLADNEQLIMYTCYPFETMVGTKTDRLFVYCEKISGPTVID